MERLFLDDAYRASCPATLTSVEGGRLRLDRTVFYPNGGGQPGDTGHLELDDGSMVPIVDTVKGQAMDDVVHITESGHPLPAPGTPVTAHIDWDRRYRHMRMHTTLHLLCAIVDADITGASVGAAKSRIDLNWPQPSMTKEQITARLAELAAADLPITPRWISEEELDRRPELIRTMSIRPPRGAGMIRLLEIEGVDLQPCGGTHVTRTGELVGMAVSKIENKGRHNRRINVVFNS